MAAGSRTLKLSILADVDNLKKSLNSGSTDVQSFGDKVSDFGKKAGLAFAAAGAAAAAYAGKLAIDGVKAALEDEKAQRLLALTLENTTGAQKEQIKAVEDYILKTSLSIGVTDDKLRPAYARLVRSTKDTEEAQKLLNLSLDIASATGKPLETIANSLGKAYDGNTQALGKLGLGIDQNILKTKDFNLVYENLRTSFKGFAEGEANTFQGRLDRLKVAFDEAKETIGFQLLPIIQKLVEFVVDKVIPALGKFADYFKPITQAINENKETFKAFGQFIVDYVAPVLVTVLGGAFQIIGKIAGGIIDVIAAVIKGLNVLIQGAVQGINALIGVYNSVPFLPNVGKISAPTISVPSVSVPDVGGSTSSSSITVPSISMGGSGTSGGSASATSDTPQFFNPSANFVPSFGKSSSIALMEAGQFQRESSIVNNITVNGAIDAEGTARQIAEVMNNGYYRGTGGASQFVGIK
jgi:hypothetical protein